MYSTFDAEISLSGDTLNTYIKPKIQLLYFQKNAIVKIIETKHIP